MSMNSEGCDCADEDETQMATRLVRIKGKEPAHAWILVCVIAHVSNARGTRELCSQTTVTANQMGGIILTPVVVAFGCVIKVELFK